MGDGNDGHKKADIFAKSVKSKIGTLAAPKLSLDMLTFVAENLESEAPFKAINGNNSKQAQALRKRRQAFLMVKGYAELVCDVNDQNPSCHADGPAVDACVKEFVYGAFKEILTLDTMYEQVRIGGDPINPNGYYRAFGATADHIHMSTGGLTGFLTQGEPTLVTLLVTAIEAQEASGTAHGSVLNIAPMTGGQGFGMPHQEAKRGREGEGMIQQTVPPYGWVCAFCQKPNHSALVCRNRIKEEKKQRTGQQQQQHGTQQRPSFFSAPMSGLPVQGAAAAAGMTLTPEEQDRFNSFKRFCEWQQKNQ